MTQAEMTDYLSEKCGIKKLDVKEFFTSLANLAASEVKKNGEFSLPGFGKLVRVNRAARKGRNPATGEAITIPAKTSVKFRIGKSMKDSVA